MSTVNPEALGDGTTPFTGLAGPLETVLDLPVSGTARAVAVCCHPHPLYGGSLSNKVIHTVARSCAAAGAVALRFNFRGVGRSAGVHDHGVGEALDVQLLVAQVRERWPGLPVWLAGFSFGAWISLRVSAEVAPARLITVAPPVGRWDFSAIASPACPWLLVQGERDELVDAAAVRSWVQGLGVKATLAFLPEADHFFHGQLLALRTVLDDFLAAPSDSPDPRRM